MYFTGSPIYYKRMLKYKNQQPDEAIYKGWHWEMVWSFFPFSRLTTLSSLHVFNLKSLWTLSCRDFMEASFSSVQFRRSVVSDSLRPHGLQHIRPPCPSPTPGVHSNSRPSRGHPAISSSVVPFSSCLQSFRGSGSFQMSQFFASGGQSIGVSALASVLPMNIQDWSSLGWTGWISLKAKESSSIPQFKSINSSVLSFVCNPALTPIHDYWKNHSLD